MTDFMPGIEPEVFTLRPDYAAISVVADGLHNMSTHPAVDQFVADVVASPALPSWAEGHLEAWREAYRAFGAKPQRTPCSAEALRTRIAREGRLPSVNAIVDLYNAVSVRYVMPIGGEDMEAYTGLPRLHRASGSEAFDTQKDGQLVQETPSRGEVIWSDDRGATCRRWNWRQGLRTRVSLDTRRAWFVLERLHPMPMAEATQAATTLMEILQLLCPGSTAEATVIDNLGDSRLTKLFLEV